MGVGRSDPKKLRRTRAARVESAGPQGRLQSGHYYPVHDFLMSVRGHLFSGCRGSPRRARDNSLKSRGFMHKGSETLGPACRWRATCSECDPVHALPIAARRFMRRG